MSKIDDVARLAGVSTATVSRALRGLPVVAEETRVRVAEAAARLGYVASPSASRLAGGRTGAVGIAVPRITRWFFATVVEAAEEVCYQAGLDVLLFNLHGRAQARRDLFRTPGLAKRVDALMLVALPLRSDELDQIAKLNLHGVTISSGTPVPGWASVRIDDVAAGRLATEHLLGLGHTRIAHLSGDSSEELGFTTGMERRHGYQQAMREAGVIIEPGLDVEAAFTVSGGEEATRALLRMPNRPTAIFAASDEMAIGALRALRAESVRVPEDISVIGVDDHDMSAAVGLTTIAQPAAEQGRLGAGMLSKVVETPALRSRVLPIRLVMRESTAPPRGDTDTSPAARSGGAR